MYRNKDELKVITYMEDVWWDMVRDEEYLHSVTGTLPPLQQRRIQKQKTVHLCGGDIELTDQDAPPYSAWMRCKFCGKVFLGEI